MDDKLNVRKTGIGLLVVLSLLLVAVAGNFTSVNAQAPVGTVPPLHTPNALITYTTGATKICQTGGGQCTIPAGVWAHINAACEGCEAGVELNYVVYFENSITFWLDGTVWTYNQEPTELSELCDPRDYWPVEWPANWSSPGGQLVFPCSIKASPLMPSPTSQAPASGANTHPPQTSQTQPSGFVLPTPSGNYLQDFSDFLAAAMQWFIMNYPTTGPASTQPVAVPGVSMTPTPEIAANPGQVVKQGEDVIYTLQNGKYYHLSAWFRGDSHEYNYVLHMTDDFEVTFNGTLTEFSSVPMQRDLPAPGGKQVYLANMDKFPHLKDAATLLDYSKLVP